MLRNKRRYILTFELKSYERQKVNALIKEQVDAWKGRKPCSRELLQEFEFHARQRVLADRVSKAEEKRCLERDEREWNKSRFRQEMLNGIHSFWIVEEFPGYYSEILKTFQDELLYKEEKLWWKIFHRWEKSKDFVELIPEFNDILLEISQVVQFFEELNESWGVYKTLGTFERDYYYPVKKLVEKWKHNLVEIVNN